MKLRYAASAAAVATATAAGLLTATPAQAAGGVSIYRVSYNSPGSDTGSNVSLNGEWVQLYNSSSSAISVQGWKLRDVTGYTYTFSGKIGARSYLKVHTGKGSNTAGYRYWGRSWYVWNNTGDTAYLRKSTGTLVDSCKWGSTGSSKYC
ncbi:MULTISPECIES: lamin tail domain-containing protein [unclassified Streptomyces]|uniref:lamin tail domain-containing protein n=1 Tax=unclassified Streptomyces TaxID=2593676 RepID=UPI00367AC9AC